MRKKLTGITAVLFMILLSGCMKVRMELDVAPDGQVREALVFLADRDQASSAGLDPRNLMSAAISDYTMQYPDAQTEAIEEKDGTKTYTGFCITGIEDTGFRAVKENGMLVLRVPAEKIRNTLGSQLIGMEAETLQARGIEAQLKVRMPGEPVCEYGTAEGNILTVDLLALPYDLEEIVIASRQESSASLFGMIFLAAAAGTGIYIYLHRDELLNK